MVVDIHNKNYDVLEQIFTYKIQGMPHHAIGSVMPKDSKEPIFSQLYIFDPEYQYDIRQCNLSDYHKKLLFDLQIMMQKYNPFVGIFQNVAYQMHSYNYEE